MATTKRNIKTKAPATLRPVSQPQPKTPPETPEQFWQRESQRPDFREIMERLAKA